MAPRSADAPRLRGRVPLRLSFGFLVLAIVAIVVGIVIAVGGSKSTIKGFHRVTIAVGQASVQFHAGDYVGYYEVPNGADERAYVQVAIQSSSGTAVSISDYGRNGSSSSSLTYSYGGKHGQALFKFVIHRSGRYTVAVRSDSQVAGADVAFGKSIAGGIVKGILLIVLGVVFGIVFLVLLIVGLVKRSNSKRELANPYGGYAGPPPGYGPGYGQPPPGYGPPPPGYDQQAPPGYHPPPNPPQNG